MNRSVERPEDYEDESWWRRRVSLPPRWRGRYVKLVFHGAGYVADVWINGRHARTQ